MIRVISLLISFVFWIAAIVAANGMNTSEKLCATAALILATGIIWGTYEGEYR